ncbi:MAG: cytochrome C, partial [Methylococcaceae bacterium]|nr:cytochrome C [Methylococcaceae bacterium]
MTVLSCQAAHAKPSIAITRAAWSEGTLTVSGKLKNSAATTVDLYDSSGRRLGEAPVDGKHRFTLKRANLDRPELLCSVSVKTTGGAVAVAVKGRAKRCAKVPQCKILSPMGSVTATVNTDVSFSAKAVLKDKKAQPLKMEWDFGGGAMGEAVPGTTPTTYLRPTGHE